MFKFKAYLPKIYMKLAGIPCGKKMKMIGWPFIYKFKNSWIKFGDNCSINSSFFSNLIGLYQRTIIIARGGEIEIGNNVGISGTTIYSRKRVFIGNDVLIGANCKIIDNDFHGMKSEVRDNIDFIRLGEICIDDGTFVGCNCIILKNTALGKNCVVGAGSVVHGFFPDNCVIAGNPAKIVKQNNSNNDRGKDGRHYSNNIDKK